jgi:DNA-directed RNA polymerase subunit M/transcription elongation factor TFIIS
MEKCQKCGGIMLPMKTKKSLVPDVEKKQGMKCSRCGNYVEKLQTFSTAATTRYDDDSAAYYLRRRPQ